MNKKELDGHYNLIIQWGVPPASTLLSKLDYIQKFYGREGTIYILEKVLKHARRGMRQ